MLIARALITLVLVSCLGACGDEDPDVVSEGDGAPTDEATATIQLGFRDRPDGAAADETIEVIRRRLDGLGIEDATVEREGDGITVRYPASSAMDAATVGDVLADRGELSFRPVLASTPPEGGPGCDAEGRADPDTITRLPEAYPGGSTIICHELAPAALSGSFVESARAEEGASGWTVALELRPGPAGVDAFNTVAVSCFERAPGCPTGQLAIVFDGRVMSAPAIVQPAFESDDISISGNFGPSDANELALILRSGALPVGLEVVETEDGG